MISSYCTVLRTRFLLCPDVCTSRTMIILWDLRQLAALFASAHHSFVLLFSMLSFATFPTKLLLGRCVCYSTSFLPVMQFICLCLFCRSALSQEDPPGTQLAWSCVRRLERTCLLSLCISRPQKFKTRFYLNEYIVQHVDVV